MNIKWNKVSDFHRGILFDLLSQAYSFDEKWEQTSAENWRNTDDFFFDNLDIADKYSFINPALRHQGYGTRIIAETIQYIEKIIPIGNNIIVAQIHKDNDISKKLFTKSGFHFICTDAELNDEWFDWIYPASAANRYLAWRD